MYETEIQAEAVKSAAGLDEGIRRANEAEARLGKVLHELYERLAPVCLDDTRAEADLLATPEPPRSLLANRIHSHAEAIESHVNRLSAVLYRLDV